MTVASLTASTAPKNTAFLMLQCNIKISIKGDVDLA
jgi:hypothetical protein